MTAPLVETKKLKAPANRQGSSTYVVPPAEAGRGAGLVRVSYDRGTLLLQGDGARLAKLNVDGLLWDPRVGCLRAPGYRYQQLVQALAWAGVPFLDEVHAADIVRAATNASVQGEVGQRGALRVAFEVPPLRCYQRAALEAWQLASRRGIVVLPTGSGKTRVALAAIAELGQPALVLVPTRVLLGQWLGELEQVCRGRIGRYGDGARVLEPLTVCTFESAYRYMDDFGHRFALLVVDEAHHFASGLRAEALEMCTAPARLGLTATAPEQPERAFHLEELIGPVVCRYTVSELAGEHLAPLERLRLPINLTPEERELYLHAHGCFSAAYSEFLRLGRCRNWAEFVAVASATAAGREALHAYHRARRVVSLAEEKLRLVASLLERHRDEVSLVFTADNAAAYALSRRLLVPAVTCDVSRRERLALLERLHAGKLRTLISARVLNEGIDLPDARVGIVAGGALGTREHVQRVGRLLRPAQGKRALLYEIVARATFEVEHARRRHRGLAR